MLGIEATLPDGVKVKGAIFDDDAVYLHEPICDTYASVEDMRGLTAIPFIDAETKLEIIGIVAPIDQARQYTLETYTTNLNTLNGMVAELNRNFTASMDALNEFEKLSTAPKKPARTRRRKLPATPEAA